MEALFLKLVNMSLTASCMVLVVLLLRLVFKRAPKWIFCLMWAMVAIRLICPFSIESDFSLMPSGQPLPPDIIYSSQPQIDSGVNIIDRVVNPVLSATMSADESYSINPSQIWAFALSRVWILGVCAMLLYAAGSYIMLKRRLATATVLRDNIKQSELIASPFLLGFFHPIIYLPYEMFNLDKQYVIAHEQAHIKRGDHWWKLIGFTLLAVYWFNPVLWLAYVLLCRDIESACDEKVIATMARDERRAYSMALLNCSVKHSHIGACPLAFGEVGVKERIKNVMDYKKPAFWLLVLAVTAIVIAAACLLTDPKEQDLSFLNYENLATLAYQTDSVSVSHGLDNVAVSVNGHALGEFISNAKWSEKSVSSPYELSADIIISFNSDLELRFYEAEPMLAMIVSLDKWRYYEMKNTEYDDVVQLLKNNGESAQWDLIPMIMVDGVLYLDTGINSNEARCGVLDGEITTSVEGSERPQQNDQSNFGTGYGYQYSGEGTIDVELDGVWRIFATEEKRQELQFPENKPADQNAIDAAITDAVMQTMPSQYAKGCICVESHDVLATEVSPSVKTGEPAYLTVYAHILYEAFAPELNEKGELVASEGSYIPTILTFSIDGDDNYTLAWYWVPRDGDYYAKDIKAKFPEAIVEDALNNQKFVDDVVAQNRVKAYDTMKKLNKAAE